MASTSTSSSGAARARTSTRVETGKSPENASRRAFHTSSRRLMSVTKITTLTMSSMRPPAASIKWRIFSKMALDCPYMLSPPTTSAPARAGMPATKTWVPTTRALAQVCGGGSGPAELETRRFFIGARSFLWHGVIEEDLDRGILALPARPAPPDRPRRRRDGCGRHALRQYPEQPHRGHRVDGGLGGGRGAQVRHEGIPSEKQGVHRGSTRSHGAAGT